METETLAQEATVMTAQNYSQQHVQTAENFAKFHSDRQAASQYSAGTVSKTRKDQTHVAQTADLTEEMTEDQTTEVSDEVIQETEKCLTLYVQTAAKIAKSLSDHDKDETFSVHDVLIPIKENLTDRKDEVLTNQALTATTEIIEIQVQTEVSQMMRQTTKHNLKL